jgi:hypothetical protein
MASVVPLAIAAAGLVVRAGRDRRLAVALATCVMLFILVLFLPLAVNEVAESVIRLRGFQFDRFYLLLPFAAVLAGALGAEALAERITGRLDSSGALRILAVIPAVVLAGAAAVYATDALMQMQQDARAGATWAQTLGQARLSSLADESRQGDAFRVVTVSDAAAGRQQAAFAWPHGLETADGYSPLYGRRYQEFWGKTIEPVLSREPGLSSYFWGWGNRVYLWAPEWASAGGGSIELASIADAELLALANVRYVISDRPLRTGSSVVEVRPGSGTPFVYEAMSLLPRYYLATGILCFQESRSALAAMASASLGELATVAFVTEGDIGDAGLGGLTVSSAGCAARRSPATPLSVEVLRESDSGVTLRTRAGSKAVLIASLAYSEFWKARIDGRAQPTFPVDHCFVGVAIPAGTAIVVLEYDPPYSLW